MDALLDWLAALFMGIAALFGGEAAAPGYQGYVEADYVRVALPGAGTLEHLAVRRGEAVQTGDLLFLLDDTAARAARDRAAARLAAAEAGLADLSKGARSEEISALEAQRRQALASLALSRVELERQQRLFDSNVTAESRLDAARSAFIRDSARVAELEADIATAHLGARSDAIAAAAAEVDAAKAALAEAEWDLAQRSAAAPAPALVDDTLYAEGEHVPGSAPVVSLLPAGNLYLRFFVPEGDLGRIALGQRLRVSCDGCTAAIDAAVSFVAPEAEYTPPVIYSETRREKLVFCVEARPVDGAAGLHPGQPVSVLPVAGPPTADGPP